MQPTAYDRLQQAKRLIESVMAELDAGVVACGCSEHFRHYRNWSEAQVHVRLSGYAQKLGRESTGEAIARLSRLARQAR